MATVRPVQPLSPFGALLRSWRRERGVSQLALALAADTTARHISFLETGRSRPSREMVLRLAEALDIGLRDRNRLLEGAGLPALYPREDLHARSSGRSSRRSNGSCTHTSPTRGWSSTAIGTWSRPTRRP
jgi:transcriptional regulator with XRE-family HTH domain